MQMQELEIFRIFGEEKAFLTESIKTLNGKSCSPQVITATIGSFICGNSFFVHGQEEKKKGRGWFEIYGSSCAPSQILAFHLTSAVETKVLSNPSEHSHSSLVVLLSDPLVGSVQITGNCLDFHSLMGFY